MVVRPRKVPQPTRHHQHLTTTDSSKNDEITISTTITSESDQSGNKKQLLRQDILPKNVVKESVVAKNAIPTNIPTGMHVVHVNGCLFSVCTWMQH